MKRLVMVSAATLAVVFAVAMQACSSSGSTGSDTGTPTGGSSNDTSAGSGNTIATSSAGNGASGSTSVAGSSSSSGAGGAVSTSGAGAGGAPSSGGGASGATSTAGATSAAGATSTAGASGSTSVAGAGGATGGMPPAACDATVKKAGTCTTEGSVCSKTCGPGSSGYKSETCTAGAYVEGDCMFVPGGNYACYEKATPLPACSVATPTSSAACSDAPCMPCGPNYIDSTNTMKVGACVCANMKWSCASDTAWPPQ